MYNSINTHIHLEGPNASGIELLEQDDGAGLLRGCV